MPAWKMGRLARADFRLARGLPEDSRAGDVAAHPDLAEQVGCIERLDALALPGGEFGGEGLGWELVGAAAGNREELHRPILMGEAPKNGLHQS